MRVLETDAPHIAAIDLLENGRSRKSRTLHLLRLARETVPTGSRSPDAMLFARAPELLPNDAIFEATQCHISD
jgi:hypothetical protein